MKVVIDRFEGDYAIVELPDKTVQHIPAVLLPGAAEGDVVTVEIDEEETKRRKNGILDKYKNLWKD